MLQKNTILCFLLAALLPIIFAFKIERAQTKKFTKFNFEFVGSVNGKAYFWLPNHENENVDWIDSIDICHQGDLSIATILDMDEQLFLEASGERLGWNQFVSLGGSDLFTEGNWRWLKSGKTFDYTNWLPGTPFPEDKGGRKWNCLGLDPLAGWKWVDILCKGNQVITLCEYP